MRLELTGRHVDITPALRRLVERKLAKLERLLDHAALSAQVVLTQGRRQPRVDITVHARGERFLHGAAEAAAWEPALTAVIEKLTQQAQKVKGKWQARKRRPQPLPEAPEPAVPAPVPSGRSRARMPRTYRVTRQLVEELSVAQAAARFDGGGGDLVIFRDPEIAGLHVLYRTHGGELVLVRTDV